MARRGTASFRPTRSVKSHGPLHHSPAALDGRAAPRDQLPDLRDLLHAAGRRSRGAARRSSAHAGAPGVDPSHPRARQALVHPVPEVPRPAGLPLRLRLQLQNSVSVKSQIFDRLPATMALAVGGAVVWLLVGIPIGIISAIKRGTWMDRAAMGGALIAISAPVYWLGLVSLYLFSKDLGKIPIFEGQGRSEEHTSELQSLRHLV